MQDIEEAMRGWGARRRELFEQYCEEKGKDASIIFNEEEWNKFAEWEKNNDVIAREVRIYKCNKIDYGFNADDELELDRQIVNWESEPNEKFDEFVNDEVKKRFGITYEDDEYYEKYEEVQDEIAHKYLDKRAEGLVEFINDFGGDYTATLREYTASDCESLGMTVEELREYAENERVFYGGLSKKIRV